ncbi:PREDICTED: RNA pseudouridylate synthase domain-containing protein 4-like [Wasmannia auropunctata]|uniref:RNA pseudouridylate synthase domain-containing protein 4-like n=1 Tax=Wasmannia auropunctata TaxID=64793 RepID=UPI0005EED4D1|nr:PREDICTED: RNA pseudouridylate synthase domain-containing protein 4-like [Wasmannia auropunctata]XP_011703225.1 PREDICTED: RNA pseudouridylate synthase domain-containing protein 4-like [Wasmannia auropunctata]XP_011703226.1 PREDICTED: RNA pseudouridylate synthase domain-containing protein 4-like [Wasmannia auropunctata]
MKGAMTIFRNIRISEFAAAFRTCYRKYNTTENYTTTKEKVVHPYCRIHPWKSEDEFAKDLLKNIIYNKDGIIAINKPYGIPLLPGKIQQRISPNVRKQTHKIVGALDYTVTDALPYLKSELNVPDLIPCLGSEMYMSGVYIFGINEKIVEQLKTARHRTQGKYRKYWVVTIRVPNEIKGNYRLAMTLKKSVLGEKKPIMLTQWSNNAVKRNEVKIMNIDHKVLTNSTHNLSSLIEIQASARKWNGVRLFASTMLYAPILGDNIHGSRIQELMGTWLKVDPFADSCWDLPKVNKQLLDLLNVAPSKQEIIPAHIHLRSVHLIYGKEQKDITIEAPLIDPFYWTCKQLKFKLPAEAEDSVTDNVEELASMKHT